MILDEHPDAVDAILAAQRDPPDPLSARDHERLAFLKWREKRGDLDADMAPIQTVHLRLPRMLAALARPTFPAPKPSSNPDGYPHEDWSEC